MSIRKPIDEITESDLEALVQAGVAEGHTLDYKEGVELDGQKANDQ